MKQSAAAGGGDIPEAVVEALDAGLKLFDKKVANDRLLVVFGDAPQHDSPRGKILESDVLARIKAANVSVQTILLPVTNY